MRESKFLLLFLMLCMFFGSQAQQYNFPTEFTADDVIEPVPTEMPSTWTFEDCVNWAIANNNDIRRTMLSILEADENIGMAKDAWLPYFGFSTSHNYTNYAFPRAEQETGNNYGSSYNISASWTIWEGNVRSYRIASSKLMKKQQELSGDDIVRTLKLGILQAYLNILYSEEAVEIAKQSLEVSKAQADRTKRLMETGKTSKVDYAQIESQRAQDEYNLVQAQTSYASAKATLKNFLNLGLDYDMRIQTLNFPDSMVNTPLLPKTTVYDIAAEWLPQIKSNELNKDILDYDIKIARSTYYPTISLNGGIGSSYNSSSSAGWGTQMKGFLNENIGINLSVPIWDGNATRRAVSIAKLQALDYDLNKTQLLNELSQTIENLYIETENARAKYVAGISQLESTTISADLVNRQFELGLVNPLELLTAHNNLLNARLELLQSKYMAILSNKTIEYYATQSVILE